LTATSWYYFKPSTTFISQTEVLTTDLAPKYLRCELRPTASVNGVVTIDIGNIGTYIRAV